MKLFHTCAQCDGAGLIPHEGPSRDFVVDVVCPKCHGQGEVLVEAPPATATEEEQETWAARLWACIFG